MNKYFLRIFLTVLVICSLILIAIFLVNLTEDEKPEGILYSFPISVAEKTYMISIRSNYTSQPEVSYFGLDKSVLIDFRGDPENAFCNVTIPSDLIWGELSLIAKYYEMDKDYYVKSNNSTHNSIYFMFNQTALVKHFEIKGTKGIPDTY